MCSIPVKHYFRQMSHTISNSHAADNGPSASKIQEGDETEWNETMDKTMKLELDGMEQRLNNASSKEQDAF